MREETVINVLLVLLLCWVIAGFLLGGCITYFAMKG